MALINRVGHAYIKHRMREEGAVFGGEVSAHYYFRDFTQADSGVVPFLLMLELISKRGPKLSEILRPFRERYFLTGELNTPVADTGGQAPGAGGAVCRRPDHQARRDLGRVRRLALQRPPVQHRALAAPQPRGALGRAAGGEARRGDRRSSVSDEPVQLGRVTDRKPPFKYSAIARVWFSDTDAQGIVYYGRYLPYFDHARTEYHRHLGIAGAWISGRDFVMRASSVEYHAPARFDDLLEIFVRLARIGPDERDLRVRGLPDVGRRADGHRLADPRPRRSRHEAGGRDPGLLPRDDPQPSKAPTSTPDARCASEGWCPVNRPAWRRGCAPVRPVAASNGRRSARSPSPLPGPSRCSRISERVPSLDRVASLIRGTIPRSSEVGGEPVSHARS